MKVRTLALLIALLGAVLLGAMIALPGDQVIASAVGGALIGAGLVNAAMFWRRF